ncbi:hypothetical protein C8R46DRAFT_292560 [Mycena filopes]|nr:hypothetical protein C8R46DRAFT_292560 [Mycena filopes]
MGFSPDASGSNPGRRIRAVLNIHVYILSMRCRCTHSSSPPTAYAMRRPAHRNPHNTPSDATSFASPCATACSTFPQPLRRRRARRHVAGPDTSWNEGYDRSASPRMSIEQARDTPPTQAFPRGASRSSRSVMHLPYMHPLAQRAEDPPPDGMMQRARLGADVPRERDTMIARVVGRIFGGDPNECVTTYERQAATQSVRDTITYPALWGIYVGAILVLQRASSTSSSRTF